MQLVSILFHTISKYERGTCPRLHKQMVSVTVSDAWLMGMVTLTLYRVQDVNGQGLNTMFLQWCATSSGRGVQLPGDVYNFRERCTTSGIGVQGNLTLPIRFTPSDHELSLGHF